MTVLAKACRVCGSTRVRSDLSSCNKLGVRWRCVDCTTKKAADWNKNNSEKRKVIRAKWMKKQSERLRREHWLLKFHVFMELGGICECCGEGDLRFLTVDHIHGGGSKHRRATGNNASKMYLAIREEGCPKDKYRVLCWNCHMSTRYGDLCPHRELKDAIST